MQTTHDIGSVNIREFHSVLHKHSKVSATRPDKVTCVDTNYFNPRNPICKDLLEQAVNQDTDMSVPARTRTQIKEQKAPGETQFSLERTLLQHEKGNVIYSSCTEVLNLRKFLRICFVHPFFNFMLQGGE